MHRFVALALVCAAAAPWPAFADGPCTSTTATCPATLTLTATPTQLQQLAATSPKAAQIASALSQQAGLSAAQLALAELRINVLDEADVLRFVNRQPLRGAATATESVRVAGIQRDNGSYTLRLPDLGVVLDYKLADGDRYALQGWR
jgi:hypothetical protein